MDMTTPESPFLKLRGINVNAKTEKKGNLTYLSWAWAVDQLLTADCNANWTYLDPLAFGDTLMVRCSVTAFGITRTAQLPVMNHKNQPIAKPDAFQVNTAMQRCLAKGIALHGLGLYIYAGEDVPPDDAEKPEADQDGEQEQKKTKGRKPNPPNFYAWNQLTDDQKIALVSYRDRMTDAINSGDTVEAARIFYDEVTAPDGVDDNEARLALWSCFASNEKTAVTKAQDFRKEQSQPVKVAA